jgi:hypothetical protein
MPKNRAIGLASSAFDFDLFFDTVRFEKLGIYRGRSVTFFGLRTRFSGMILVLLFCSCMTSKNLDEKYGIDAKRIGYVPARIALLPCMFWPTSGSKINDLSPNNRPPEENTVLCEEFDKYVADGFDNQPFMKGLSPKLVEKLYAAAGLSPQIFTAISTEWAAKNTDCKDCRSLPAMYKLSIKGRQQWQIWLSKVSSATKGADAVMIPLVLSSNTRIENDRGILLSIRSGSIGMLLIDTNNGSLIWSGGRQAEVIYKAFANSVSAKAMREPPLDDLKRRLLTDAIWIDFPGRQIYR